MFGCEDSTGKNSPLVEMARESPPAAGSGCCAPISLQTSGMSKASAGIWGRDSLRGPPQAEQDMEVGVFCRVHLRQSQARLRLSASSSRLPFCRSVDGGFGGLEPTSEPWGRGRSSDESWGRSGAAA